MAIVSSVLRAGTVVKLTVEATSPRVQTFTIERSVNNTPVVKDASGTVTSLQSADVIGDVEIFGQHELAELAISGVGGVDRRCCVLDRR